MLELTFQEQERKINDAAFAKYKPELVRLMNELETRILNRPSISGIFSNGSPCPAFRKRKKRITRISSGNGKKRREDTSI